MSEPLMTAQAGPPAGGRKLPPLYRVTVVGARDVAPNMRRVDLAFPEGTGFTYTPGQAVVMLLPQADETLARRDYTIRAQEGDVISVDVLMHADTPGPMWAREAKVGDEVDLRGPRGHLALKTEADWHVMSGDETCIPAFAHMLEVAPAGAKIHLFLEVAGPEGEIDLPTKADLSLTWVHRQGALAGPSDLMANVIAGFALPEGRGQAYIIGETSNVRRQRQDLVARGFTREQILSEGYWRPGRIGGHDHVND